MAAVQSKRGRKSRKMPVALLSGLSAHVQIQCLLLLIIISNNRAIYTRKKKDASYIGCVLNKMRTFRINGTFRLK